MHQRLKDSDFLNYVEERLAHWAKWYSQGNFNGLGFHSETREYVLMTVGHLIKGTGGKPVPYDEQAEEIESLVREMSKHNDLMALALRMHYFGKGPIKQRPKQFGISYSKFKIYVDMAKQWLAGRLTSKIKCNDL